MDGGLDVVAAVAFPVVVVVVVVVVGGVTRGFGIRVVRGFGVATVGVATVGGLGAAFVLVRVEVIGSVSLGEMVVASVGEQEVVVQSVFSLSYLGCWSQRKVTLCLLRSTVSVTFDARTPASDFALVKKQARKSTIWNCREN